MVSRVNGNIQGRENEAKPQKPSVTSFLIAVPIPQEIRDKDIRPWDEECQLLSASLQVMLSIG